MNKDALHLTHFGFRHNVLQEVGDGVPATRVIQKQSWLPDIIYSVNIRTKFVRVKKSKNGIEWFLRA